MTRNCRVQSKISQRFNILPVVFLQVSYTCGFPAIFLKSSLPTFEKLGGELYITIVHNL
jgi:hypothetical protein